MNWTSEVGPRKTKRFVEALKAVEREAHTFEQILKDGTCFIVNSPCSPVLNEHVQPALLNAGNDFDWKLTAKNYDSVMTRMSLALRFVQEHRPVEDRRLA